MINSRKTDDLLPDVAAKAYKFKAQCLSKGVDILITSTFRDYAYQNFLYAQGRTTPGKVVTKAKGGDSFHNFRVAFDFVPLHAGEPVWNDSLLWELCGSVAESCELDWGGKWKFVDKPHCQYTSGKSLADYRKGN